MSTTLTAEEQARFFDAQRAMLSFAAAPQRRAPMLLGLLAPSFRHGFLARRRLMAHLSALDRSVDALAQPAGLYRLDGRLRHANARLRDRLSGPDAERRRRPIQDAVARVARASESASTVEEAMGARPQTAGPTAVRLDTLGGEPLVLVLLPPGQARVPPVRTLRERFGLTRRQAEAARLLAVRKTNPELAAALGISPHTARRHTEAVMAKLGVRSRRDIADALLAS